MCGIICILSENQEKPSLEEQARHILSNRGPDHSKVIIHENILFGGFVLWTQGNDVCAQPLENSSTILLLNGDLFNIVDELQEGYSKSDSMWLLDELTHCQNDLEILELLKHIQGPYSLIFYKKFTNCLYFARDSLGRNSLLIEKSPSNVRIVSSTYVRESSSSVMELPPLGLYKLNASNLNEILLFPWINQESTIEDQLNAITKKLGIPVASSAHFICPNWLSTQIQELEAESYDFYELCKVPESSTEEIFKRLISNSKISNELEKFDILLRRSVECRVTRIPKFCQNCINKREKCNHAKISILFSGGIDCSILAILASHIICPNDPIELINFSCGKDNNTTSTPDRISAKSTLMELKNICPSRKWNFIEINVSRDKCKEMLSNHIKNLIYPLNTILDESLGTAFWFAAHGEGLLDNTPYISTARVTIVGSGADELFGGYKRHRTAFIKFPGDNGEKSEAVQTELENDWKRIPSRNLARDDRVMADSKRTPRAPYIEEKLVQYVRSLKANQRSCYTLPDGIGDKLFLRLYGYKLGLRNAAYLKKRAIQFGSRIANKKQNASDISEYLKATA